MTSAFTTTVAAGTFTSKPEVVEVIPTSAKKASPYAPYRPADELDKYRYYRRILAIIPDNAFTDEYGNGDAQFSQQNADSFTIIVKSYSYDDARAIYNNFREICKAHPFNASYDRVELLSFNKFEERSASYLVGGVRCFNVAGAVA
jgi:hypothetical protein